MWKKVFKKKQKPKTQTLPRELEAGRWKTVVYLFVIRRKLCKSMEGLDGLYQSWTRDILLQGIFPTQG